MANIFNNRAPTNIMIPRAVMNSVLKTGKLNICHINVQSLCARQLTKFEELKATFEESRADIICMSETWVDNDINDALISIKGYNLLPTWWWYLCLLQNKSAVYYPAKISE